MPVTIFAMLVFGICSLLGAGLVEVVMRNFAAEAGVPTWGFIIAPAGLSMLFALLIYPNAVRNVSDIRQSLSRAFLVAILTWLVLGVYISALWCPAYRALGCARGVAIVLTAVGGGALALAGV